ncbi:hypothetical protein TSMEX_002132 [Taenia solium]|eukprot:TsM_000392500 transcript=TsM_000392500 gene=TsM_000392500
MGTGVVKLTTLCPMSAARKSFSLVNYAMLRKLSHGLRCSLFTFRFVVQLTTIYLFVDFDRSRMVSYTKNSYVYVKSSFRLTVTECANGTPTCSHGRCVQRTGWDEEHQPVNEQRCICEPNFYGESCDLLVVSDFAKPVVISPGHIILFAHKAPEGTAVTDPVNEKHSYGGAI